MGFRTFLADPYLTPCSGWENQAAETTDDLFCAVDGMKGLFPRQGSRKNNRSFFFVANETTKRWYFLLISQISRILGNIPTSKNPHNFEIASFFLFWAPKTPLHLQVLRLPLHVLLSTCCLGGRSHVMPWLPRRQRRPRWSPHGWDESLVSKNRDRLWDIQLSWHPDKNRRCFFFQI